MTNYTKTTDFAAKDSLPSGDSGKIIRGSEFETEFDNIATAVNSKSDANNPTFTGTVTIDGLTVNGNTILGNAATDTVTVTADIASNLIPSADDTYNLGAVGAEWNDLFIDGTANIDSLVAGSGSFTSISTTGDMTFGDGNKAIFGAGPDLQIYHDNTEGSIIEDVGAGGLIIKGTPNITFKGVNDETLAVFSQNDASELYHNNFQKLATTATGIDVTGTVVSDGLTSSGNLEISNTVPLMDFMESDQTDKNTRLVSTNGDFEIRTLSDNKATQTTRFSVDNPTGDISFYESTGTTPKFFWDSSAASLGIGTSSPLQLLHVQSASGSDAALQLRVSDTTSSTDILFGDTGNASAGKIKYGHSNNALSFSTSGTERMLIDSAGKVGINTSSPGAVFDVQGNTQDVVGVFRSTDAVGKIGLMDNATTNTYSVTVGASGNNLVFGSGTNGVETMRISSNGNVGIGNTDPDTFVDNGLAVSKQVDEDVISTLFLGPSSSDRGFRFAHSEFSGVRHFYHIFNGTPSSTEGTYTQGAYGGTSVIKFDNSGHLDFYTTGQAVGGSSTSVTPSHAVRISSNGQVLVGKTASTSATVGCELRQDGHIVGTCSGAPALTLNRTTSDGTVAEFRKDGTTVGSIGVGASNNLYIGSSATDHTGLVFPDNAILPAKESVTTDAFVDLGSSSKRFKDLYLSGGVYLGGVAAANKLDDYEEGTWTPVLSDGTNTVTIPSGSYTKVGNVVTVVIAGYNRDTSGLSGSIKITGLPFTSGGADQAVPLYYRDGGTAGDSIFGYIASSTTEILIRENRGSAAAATDVSATAATTVFSTVTYRTG